MRRYQITELPVLRLVLFYSTLQFTGNESPVASAMVDVGTSSCLKFWQPDNLNRTGWACFVQEFWV